MQASTMKFENTWGSKMCERYFGISRIFVFCCTKRKSSLLCLRRGKHQKSVYAMSNLSLVHEFGKAAIFSLATCCLGCFDIELLQTYAQQLPACKPWFGRSLAASLPPRIGRALAESTQPTSAAHRLRRKEEPNTLQNFFFLYDTK